MVNVCIIHRISFLYHMGLTLDVIKLHSLMVAFFNCWNRILGAGYNGDYLHNDSVKVKQYWV